MDTFINRFREKCNSIVDSIHYKIENRKNHYQCKLVGEKTSAVEICSVVIFRILGKRDVFEIPVNKLLENQKLIEKFCPTDAVKIGIIAMGDIILNEENQTKAKQKLEQVKQHMFR